MILEDLKSPNTRRHGLYIVVYHFVYATICEIQAKEEVLVDYGKMWDSYIRKLCHESI